MRKTSLFNDGWIFEKPGFLAEAVTLPHTWNAKDGQDGGNDYWRGTAGYKKTFARPALSADERLFIEFKGVAMEARVCLNGTEIAYHAGGYSAFRAEMTPYLQEENLIEVSVDNSNNDRIYPQKADFTFYGGIYRDVSLITVKQAHFELVKDGTPGLKVTPVVDLEKKCAEVTVEAWANAGGSIVFEVEGEAGILRETAALQDGYAKAVFMIENVRLWDGLADPYLYTARAVLYAENGADKEALDEICTRFGCRVFRADPEKGFFLNGRPYPLRGVSRHQDRYGIGNALGMKEHCEDMQIVRELGANTLRLAHYQHAQEFYDLCDENGIVVWAEIPFITMFMQNGRQNTLTQMKELVTQCYNHPSIACWGLSNEITAASVVDETVLENHRELNELCHRLDPTRPTVMAHAFMLEIESPLIPIADMASYNLYFGWYLGELSQNEEFFDEYHAKYPDRVIGFSEYGADANPAFHSKDPQRGDYTEEYQCLYHEHMLKLIDERPYLWATHVWNLFDFAADGRDEGGKNGQNQKGLVTMDRKLKKDAFYLYKAAWSKEPFVHLCGSRRVDREEEVTEIKVYSNQQKVALYVDGKLFEEKEGERIFSFMVPISGKHEVKAVSGGLSDTMTVVKTEKPNEDYIFNKTIVVNWFDKEDYKPEYYSIKDTMGELQQHPETAAILEGMMAKMRASRGDVAEASVNNANLQKMMARMTLESLLKQAGSVPEEAVRALNGALQRIKKS